MHVQTFVLHCIRSLFEILFGYGVSYVLVICMSIHLYTCNEITVDSFKHCCRQRTTWNDYFYSCTLYVAVDSSE